MASFGRHSTHDGLHLEDEGFTFAACCGDLRDLNDALAGCPHHGDRFGVLSCHQRAALNMPLNGSARSACDAVLLFLPTSTDTTPVISRSSRIHTPKGRGAWLRDQVAREDAHASQAAVITRPVVLGGPVTEVAENMSVHPPLAYTHVPLLSVASTLKLTATASVHPGTSNKSHTPSKSASFTHCPVQSILPEVFTTVVEDGRVGVVVACVGHGATRGQTK